MNGFSFYDQMALISPQTKQSFDSTNFRFHSFHIWNLFLQESDQLLSMQKTSHPPDSTPTPPQHSVPTVAIKVTAALNVLSHQISTPPKPQQQLQKYGGLKQKQHQLKNHPLNTPQPLLHL